MKNEENSRVRDENRAPVEDVEIELENEGDRISGGKQEDYTIYKTPNSAGVIPVSFARSITFLPVKFTDKDRQ